MSFTPNIPNTGQTLGFTKNPIRNNFSSLRTTIANATQPNHIDVNNAGAGKHIFVQMPIQTPGAANLPLAGEGGLITQNVVSSGTTELFYVRDAVNTYLQMTGPLFTAEGALTQGGTTMLFGGIILKWGVVSVPAAGAQAISFTTECGSDFPTNAFAAVVSRSVASLTSITSITPSTLNVNNNNATGNIYFIAIGN